MPQNSTIALGLAKMGDEERSYVEKLMDIMYFIAMKGCPFTDFKDHIEQEKLHEVKFSGPYENKSACRDFIDIISCYMFQEDLYEKLMQVNFIAMLIDRTTDRSVKEQEVLYVMFVDPDMPELCLTFFKF